MFENIVSIWYNPRLQAGPLSQQAEKEVEAMSGVGSMIRYLGREEGINEGKTEGLKALVL